MIGRIILRKDYTHQVDNLQNLQCHCIIFATELTPGSFSCNPTKCHVYVFENAVLNSVDVISFHCCIQVSCKYEHHHQLT